MDNDKAISTLNDLIETLRDGQNGFKEAAENAKNPDLKSFFNQASLERAQMVGELQQEVHALGKEPEEQDCPTIDGLKKEGRQMIKDTDDQFVDAVILGGVVETEAHEIAVYDGLITSAETFGEEDIVALLHENLEQEQHTLQQARKETKRVAQRKFARV